MISSGSAKKQLSKDEIIQKIQFYVAYDALSETEKHKHLERYYSLLVRVYKDEKKFEKATMFARYALKSASIGYPADPHRTAICQSNLGACLAIRKKYPEAIALLQQALVVYKNLKDEVVVAEIEDDLQYLSGKLKTQETINSFTLPPAALKAGQLGKSSFYPQNTVLSMLAQLSQNSSGAQSSVNDKPTVTFSMTSPQSPVIEEQKKSNHGNNTTLVLHSWLRKNSLSQSSVATPTVTFSVPSLKPTVTFTKPCLEVRKPHEFVHSDNVALVSRRHAIKHFPFQLPGNQNENTSVNQPKLHQSKRVFK